jgi:hypothetical protein
VNGGNFLKVHRCLIHHISRTDAFACACATFPIRDFCSFHRRLDFSIIITQLFFCLFADLQILRTVVEDGTASSLMQLDQNCLLSLINGHMADYQATSMDELYVRKKMEKRHPHRLSVKTALQAVATLLETFYGLIEVRVDEAGAEPRIVQLLGDTLSESQMEQLRNRVDL